MPTVQICGVWASCVFSHGSGGLWRCFDCARTLEEEAAPELGGHMKSGGQRRGSALPLNIGYVQWFKYEIFTMSTKWTLICNIENLSKVALWVSFEPYRSVSMPLLFSRCSPCSTSLNLFILFNRVVMKRNNTSLSPPWSCKHICQASRFYLSALEQWKPSINFDLSQPWESSLPCLRRTAVAAVNTLIFCLGEGKHKACSARKNIKA